MNTKRPCLQDLTARDLMTQDLLLVPREMSLQGAAHLLHQAGISGAPVVDEERRCVGVISSADYVAWADRVKTGLRSQPSAGCNFHSAWQVLAEGVDATPRVCDLMTQNPVTAPASTPITRLSQLMVDCHIHRVVVVDAQSRPLGIVSSTDILGAVARLESIANPILHGPHNAESRVAQNMV